MASSSSNRDRQTARLLLSLLTSESNTLPEEVAAESIAKAREKQLDRLTALIEHEAPISMVILGFPAKSPNRKKTISDLPDLGEVEGLNRLNQLAEKIRRFYSPGAQIRICSDGHVFSDIVGVTETQTNQYQNSIDKILLEFQFSNLSTFSMAGRYQGETAEALRSQLMNDFALPLSTFHERVKTQLETRLLFNGMHRFLFEDLCELNPLHSRTQIRNAAKSSAYELMRRSQAFSKFIELAFPRALRLSIHPQLRNSLKIGIKLVPGADRWGTPWHNVLVYHKRSFHLRHRAEAESLGAQLKWFQGRYPYFELGGN